MENQFSRTELIIGKEAQIKLNNSKVIVFGVGGVGSYIVEGLARAGVGHIVIVDNDTISESNINRQLIALHSTIGQAKVDVVKKRVLDINPNAIIDTYQEFVLLDSKDYFDESFDYVIDAIDTVSAKINIIERAKKYNVPIISSMGTGNKLDPTRFEITDIQKTSVCPLAKVIRKELAKKGIKRVKVLYSKEEPLKIDSGANEEGVKRIPGSISFVPSVAGLIIAGEVIKDLIK